jgi:putative peptide zinc metalloprotease protein
MDLVARIMDYRVVEPGRLVITFRRDVQAAVRTERDGPFYFLEDPLRNRFFRLGPAEYAVASAFDGSRTVSDVVAHTAAQLGAQALTLEQALALAKWLVDSGLAATEATTTAKRIDDNDRRRRIERRRRWNPWFLRFEIGSPNRLLTKLTQVGKVLFSREFLVAWVFCVAIACGIVAAHWNQIVGTTPIELGWRGGIQLLFAWCVLKVLHESAHGLACRHFGGRVGYFGLAFVLGMPSPFVDTSSVWRMPNKWHRIIVSLAGIYVELFVAALAVMVWSFATDEVIRQTALAIASVAGIGTLVFNLNPLMRFDGYFALSDFMEVPNLAVVAKDETRRIARRYLLALDEPESIKTTQPRWLAWYGISAVAWRWFITLSLVLLSLARFGGPVTLILCLLPCSYTIVQFYGALTKWCNGPAWGTFNRRRFLQTYGVAACCIGLWSWCFDPRNVPLSAVVDYEPLTVVRAAAPGFVTQVLVGDGDEVTAGQILAVLTNGELATELAQTANLVEQSFAKSRVHRQAGEIAKEQSEAVRRKALETKLSELKKRRDSLTIRAPVNGRIVSRGLDQMTGRWLSEGGELGSIGNESNKRIIAAISQGDAEIIGTSSSRNTCAVLAGSWQSIPVDQVEIDPSAAHTLIHPALSVENGGDLPVQHRERVNRAAADETTVTPELHEPHFRLRGSLSVSEAEHLHAGHRVTLYVRTTWLGLATRYGLKLSRGLDEAFR